MTHIDSIHAVTPCAVTRGQQLVPTEAPVWQRDPSDGSGITRPGACAHVPLPPRPDLRVHIAFDDATPGHYRLDGMRGRTRIFSGTVRVSDTGAQSVTVPVGLAVPPVRLAPLRGDVVCWRLVPSSPPLPAKLPAPPLPAPPLPAGLPAPLLPAGDDDDEPVFTQNTELELYFLPFDPSALPGSPFSRGVPVELLRMIATVIEATAPPEPGKPFGPPSTREELIAAVVRFVFARNPPSYAVTSGTAYYTKVPNWPNFDGMTLFLGRYLAEHHGRKLPLNCYDAAALVQYFLSVLGETDVSFCYIEPFGYLRETELIGRGVTNNPLYGLNDTEPLVEPGTRRRTVFTNHAFCVIESTGCVVDACVGPHLGTDTLERYLERAVDHEHKDPPTRRRGRPEDVVKFTGVTQVDALSAGVLAEEHPHVSAFRTAVGLGPSDAARRVMRQIACPWPSPLSCPDLDDSWSIAYQDVLFGPGAAQQHWHLTREGQDLVIDLYVASDDPGAAEQHFVERGALHSHEASPLRVGPGHLGAASAFSVAPALTRYLWLQGNVTVEVHAINATVDTEAIASWLSTAARSHEVDDLSPHRPSTDAVTAPATAKAGEPVEITVAPETGYLLDVDEIPPLLRLLAHPAQQLRLATERAGIVRPRAVLVDPRTLLCSTRELTISVED